MVVIIRKLNFFSPFKLVISYLFFSNGTHGQFAIWVSKSSCLDTARWRCCVTTWQVAFHQTEHPCITCCLSKLVDQVRLLSLWPVKEVYFRSSARKAKCGVGWSQAYLLGRVWQSSVVFVDDFSDKCALTLEFVYAVISQTISFHSLGNDTFCDYFDGFVSVLELTNWRCYETHFIAHKTSQLVLRMPTKSFSWRQEDYVVMLVGVAWKRSWRKKSDGGELKSLGVLGSLIGDRPNFIEFMCMYASREFIRSKVPPVWQHTLSRTPFPKATSGDGRDPTHNLHNTIIHVLTWGTRFF